MVEVIDVIGGCGVCVMTDLACSSTCNEEGSVFSTGVKADVCSLLLLASIVLDEPLR